MFKPILFYLLSALLLAGSAGAQPLQPVVVGDADNTVNIISGISVLEDPRHDMLPGQVFKSNDFKPEPPGTPNKQVTSSAYWFRFKIKNETGAPRLVLKLAYPIMDSVDYYEQEGVDSFRHYRTGEAMLFPNREYLSTDYLFTVNLAPHTEKYVYLRVSTSEALLLPLEAGTEKAVFRTDKTKDIFWGMYIGLMIGMLLYNCFVFLTTRDKSYLYYLFYMLAVALTQITISGYGFQLLWPHDWPVAKYMAFINPSFSGIAALVFIRHFLKTKQFVPRSHKAIAVFIALYIVGMALAFSGKYAPSLGVINMCASVLAIYIFVVAVAVSIKGYRPATFFAIAWAVFLTGVFIFVFSNFGILPYNNFTIYTMPVGSAMEALLLSFALADRITILKRETEKAQAQELLALQENERIVQQQNVILEGRVEERTTELQQANAELSTALVELKDAQLQLVESEKMASLGQLTAGIAHEINNPITFVSSNITPLSRDVNMLIDAIDEIEKIMTEDAPAADKHKMVDAYKNDIDFDYLKIEIEQSLFGISEGVFRTSEIVKGLRVFSHLDEADLKKVDLNIALDSTLSVTNNLLNNRIRVEKNYAGLPLVQCYPGRMNQAFLNVIVNAIHAIKEKFGEKEGGVLTLTTCLEEHDVLIKIADNGCGMDENIRKRIFEPFFTKKDVGKGAGLGLSIAYNTINQHKGHISVTSEVGAGTEFVIRLPMGQE